jgi:hypothetical protein
VQNDKHASFAQYDSHTVLTMAVMPRFAHNSMQSLLAMTDLLRLE